jgi:peptide/nickel transport system substrate-binding protein
MIRLAIAAACIGSILATGADAFDLRYGTKGLPISYGNPFMANGSPSNYTWAAMFDGLTQMDADGHLGPALAVSWEVVNPTTWRFRLRPGVKFSNGESFTADAVVATVSWLKTPEGLRSVIGGEIRDVTGAVRESEHSVLIMTARPDAILPRRLSAVSIVAPEAWARLGPEGFSRAPATTGSFMISEWSGNTGRVILQAFTGSWRPPKASRLIIINMPDNPARVQALMSGQIDIAGNIGVDDLEVIEAAGGLVVQTPAWSVQSLAFKLEPQRNSPLNDLRVRRALNLAVDKVAIVEGLFRGRMSPAGQPAARGTMGHDPDIAPYPFDRAQAKALMVEAGYPNGFDLKLEVMVDRTPGDAAVFQTVADQLAEIGVKVELRQITFATWLSQYLTGTWAAETDGFVLGWNAAPYNDVQRPMEVYSCLKPNPFYCNREITDNLIAAGEEMDLIKRESLLKTLGRAYRDDVPAIFLTETFDLFGVSARVQGLEIRNRVPAYHDISLAPR